ncbi:hypothetical protein V8F20_009660, partial [Naviculisporaceae sp. PSN 640]
SRKTTSTIDPNELLCGFDIPDEDSLEFLGSLISSGQVPRADMDEILKLSLSRGTEEWDMLLDCATTIRGRYFGPGNHEQESILPFLGLVISGQADCVLPSSGTHEVGGDVDVAPGQRAKKTLSGKPKTNKSVKKTLTRSVSHFWQDAGQEDAQQQTALRAAPDDAVKVDCLRKPVEDERSTAESNSQTNITVGSCPTIFSHHSSDEHDGSGLPSPISGVDIDEEHVAAPDTTIRGVGNPQDIIPVTNPPTEEKPASRTQRIYRSPFFSTAPAPQKKDQGQILPSQPSPPKSRPPRGTVSCLPVPPLSASHFGLIQEELASDPFRLLIAITFLIRTSGKSAIPVFRELMERFPTPAAIAIADPAEITALMHPLGLSVVRTAKIQKYARLWLISPPCKERRYLVKNYPRRGDGGFAAAGQEFGPEPDTSLDEEADALVLARKEAIGCAWEIGHLTQGRYALDSWRIFCRDVLLGRAEDWKGKGREPEFQPEWMRTLPEDKELRACLRWMWMKEGWEWDPRTGEREPLGEELRKAVDEGRVGYDDQGNLVILY